MITSRWVQNKLWLASAALVGVLIPSLVLAVSVPLSLVNSGTVNDTAIFSADLTTVPGLTQLGSVRLVDDGTQVGGQPGIFSGFDVDAVILDSDGMLATTVDQVFASSFLFQAGTTRPTANPIEQPNAAHPGPTFGSLDATTIDFATATLDLFDAVPLASVDMADGFLTLGDGGVLVANFSPEIPIGSTLFLFTGEVGGQLGEELSAFVEVSDTPIDPPIIPPVNPPGGGPGGGPVIPEPSTIVLFGSGLLGLGIHRWMKSTKKM